MRFLLAALLSVAHAGWWQRFCERNLVADDPYAFESAPRACLERELVGQVPYTSAWLRPPSASDTVQGSFAKKGHDYLMECARRASAGQGPAIEEHICMLKECARALLERKP